MTAGVRWLRPLLVALAALVVGFVPPSYGFRLPETVAGIATEKLEKPAAIEPQIPDYDRLLWQRQQDAVERASRLRRWASEPAGYEATGDHRKLVRREQAIRRQQLEQIADLVPEEYRLLVLDVANQYGLDPRLLAAVGTVESRWQARARGSFGDSGLMQILPGTAAWIAGQMGLEAYDLYDPRTNLSMGAWYLQALRQEHGSWDRALAAYNGGPKAVRLGSQHPYVGRVMQVYRSGLAEVALAKR